MTGFSFSVDGTVWVHDARLVEITFLFELTDRAFVMTTLSEFFEARLRSPFDNFAAKQILIVL